MKKKTKRRLPYQLAKKWGILCLTLLVVLLPSACGRKEKTNGREIDIPILAEASWLLADGSFINGVKLAEEDVNQEYGSRGFTVQSEVLDDQALYEKGVEVAAQVAADPKVTAVFNLQDFDVSQTTAGMLSSGGKLTIFPYGAYDSLFSKDNPLVFCGVPSFADLGRAMADYAVSKGYKRLAVYHNGSQSQEELVTALELRLLNSGSKVVDYVPAIASASEFDNIDRRWQALGVDCAVISQYGQDRAFEVLKLVRSREPQMAVVGEPIFNGAGALAANQAIAEGMAVPSTLVIEDSAKLRDFKERYRQKYGREADIWAVQGYDLLRLVADTAVRLDTNDPRQIAQALHEEKGYAGVGRNIAFTAGGALVTDSARLPILICRGGAFE